MRPLFSIASAALLVTGVASAAEAQSARPTPAQVAALKALAQSHKAELQAATQAAKAAAQTAKAEGKSRQEIAKAAVAAARAALKAQRPGG